MTDTNKCKSVDGHMWYLLGTDFRMCGECGQKEHRRWVITRNRSEEM